MYLECDWLLKKPTEHDRKWGHRSKLYSEWRYLLSTFGLQQLLLFDSGRNLVKQKWQHVLFLAGTSNKCGLSIGKPMYLLPYREDYHTKLTHWPLYQIFCQNLNNEWISITENIPVMATCFEAIVDRKLM